MLCNPLKTLIALIERQATCGGRDSYGSLINTSGSIMKVTLKMIGWCFYRLICSTGDWLFFIFVEKALNSNYSVYNRIRSPTQSQRINIRGQFLTGCYKLAICLQTFTLMWGRSQDFCLANEWNEGMATMSLWLRWTLRAEVLNNELTFFLIMKKQEYSVVKGGKDHCIVSRFIITYSPRRITNTSDSTVFSVYRS